MRLVNLLAFVVGAVVVIVLFATLDRAAISLSVAAVGWGLAVVCIYRVIPILCETIGWSQLISSEERPRFSSLLTYRWISKAINTLLPAMQIGGDLVRTGLLVQAGAKVEAAGASVIVDVTIWLAAQVIFVMLGVAVFAAHGLAGGTMAPIIVSLAVGAGLIAAFFIAQQHGLLRGFAKVGRRWAGPAWADRFATAFQSMDRSVAVLYRSRPQVVATGIWHLLGWLLRTGDTWLAAYFMGMSIGLSEALILESVSIAVRSAAFMVPAGVGAQEATIVAVGLQLGLSPEASVALALIKRLQELVVFLPGLAAWYSLERDHWAAGRRRLAGWRIGTKGSMALRSRAPKAIVPEADRPLHPDI